MKRFTFNKSEQIHLQGVKYFPPCRWFVSLELFFGLFFSWNTLVTTDSQVGSASTKGTRRRREKAAAVILIWKIWNFIFIFVLRGWIWNNAIFCIQIKASRCAGSCRTKGPLSPSADLVGGHLIGHFSLKGFHLPQLTENLRPVPVRSDDMDHCGTQVGYSSKGL